MEQKWVFKQLMKINPKATILIEGLPGMGNVGKIALDFMIESLGAKKVYEISSYSFPNCVFINEKNIVELPKMGIYHKKIKGKDILFLSGDVQPLTEVECYEFCDNVLNIFKKNKISEIVTLGGIGLNDIPEEPKLYYVISDKKQEVKYKGIKKAYGFVGPIMGVSGVLVGLGKERKIPGAILLAETYNHPNYLGIKGARAILKFLDKNYSLGLKIKDLDKEIKYIESELKQKLEQITAVQERTNKGEETTNYIG